jgi:hypothetical protein
MAFVASFAAVGLRELDLAEGCGRTVRTLIERACRAALSGVRVLPPVRRCVAISAPRPQRRSMQQLARPTRGRFSLTAAMRSSISAMFSRMSGMGESSPRHVSRIGCYLWMKATRLLVGAKGDDDRLLIDKTVDLCSFGPVGAAGDRIPALLSATIFYLCRSGDSLAGQFPSA